ncbi:MAG: aldo/keto reductase [Verrucomicrobia bacterium]|nr:aldo/keto reductase [Verrucomicrobiota bacterium]
MRSDQKSRREFLVSAATGAIALGTSCSTQRTGLLEGRTDAEKRSQAGGLRKRILGRSKLSVSLLGFGVLHVTDPVLYQRAVNRGVTYFHFVEDENTRNRLAPDIHNLGACAALRPFRRDLVVSYMTVQRSSKAVMLHDLDGFLHGSGFGHLDIWYVCCPTPGQWDDFCEAFTEARQAGKARYAAISTHRLAEDMERLTTADNPVDVVMLTYNYTCSADDQARLVKLHAAGLGVVPMKPLAGRFYDATTDRPDACLRWLAADPRVHSLPVAMQSAEQLDENIAALQQPLSEEDRRRLTASLSHVSPRFCRMCGACDAACPNGLAISDLVRVAMYLEGYRDPGLARLQLESIPTPRRRVSCHGCAQCSVVCPNGVAVRDRILKAQEIMT